MCIAQNQEAQSAAEQHREAAEQHRTHRSQLEQQLSAAMRQAQTHNRAMDAADAARRQLQTELEATVEQHAAAETERRRCALEDERDHARAEHEQAVAAALQKAVLAGEEATQRAENQARQQIAGLSAELSEAHARMAEEATEANAIRQQAAEDRACGAAALDQAQAKVRARRDICVALHATHDLNPPTTRTHEQTKQTRTNSLTKKLCVSVGRSCRRLPPKRPASKQAKNWNGQARH